MIMNLIDRSHNSYKEEDSGALALIQQGHDPLGHGARQAGSMLGVEGVLKHCQQFCAKQIPEMSIELIRQAVRAWLLAAC